MSPAGGVKFATLKTRLITDAKANLGVEDVPKNLVHKKKK